MIPKNCKRLAEVDFPIAEVSKHALREKSIRHGHPSTLHLWWARRPLASSRAVLLALLWPDPCDPLCPTEFKDRARTVRCESPNCGAETPLARSFWLCKKAKRRRALKHRVVRATAETPRIEI